MSDITIDQVTTTDPDESGVFDILMKSVGSHLDKQYVAGRIKGADYATVYLGALQAVLQQSIMFVLSEQKTEKDIELATAQIEATKSDAAIKLEQSAKDLELKSQQIVSMISDDLIKERQVVVTENQSAKDLVLKDNQIESIQTDINTKLQQSNKELEVKSQQITSMIKEDLVKDNQIEAIQVDITTKLQQSSKELEVKDQQIASMIADDLVKDRQVVVTENQSGKDLEVKSNQIQSIQTDMNVKLQQSDKDLEVKSQQLLTEEQQTILIKEQHEKLEYETTQILPKQGTLLTSQNLEVIAGTARENNKSTSQIALVDQQKLSEVQNTRLVDANTDAKEYEVTNILPKQALLLDQQKIQLEEQIDLLEQQYLTEIQSTTLTGNNAAKVAYETANILPKQALLIEQQELTETQQTAKLAFEVTELLPEQVDLLQSQDLEVIASTTRENSKATAQVVLLGSQTLTEVQQARLVDANADKTEYEVSTLLPQQYDKVLEEIDLLQSQDLEIIASTTRQDNESAKKVTLLEQQELTETEQTKLVASNTSKVDYEVSTILPKQAAILEQQEITETINSSAGAYKLSYHLPVELSKLENEVGKLENEIVLLDSQNAEIVASTIRQDDLTEKQILKIKEETDILQSQDLEIIAGTIRQNAANTESIEASQANTTLKNTLGAKQGAVYDGQAASFAKEAKFKVFKSLLDLRTTGMTQELAGLNIDAPGIKGANDLANFMLGDVGITGVTGIISNDIAA
jgi:hypothetical protein